MKTICFRLITFILFAFVLNYVSESGIRIDDGTVFLVGKCSLAGWTSSKGEKKALPESLTIGIAQVKLSSNPEGRVVADVNRVFSVKPDEDGYYMLKNLPAGFSYLFLGAQTSNDRPINLQNLVLANVGNVSGCIVSLGDTELESKFCEGKESLKVGSAKESSIDVCMQHFIAKDSLTRFVHYVCNRNGFWGNSNGIVCFDARCVKFSGLKKAKWQAILTRS